MQTALACFSQEDGAWFVEPAPDGRNADLLKHAQVDLQELRATCHAKNEQLLADQVCCACVSLRGCALAP